jgi:cytochrome c peroxidase
MGVFTGRSALIYRACLIGCVLASSPGCERESEVTRLEGIRAAEATQSTLGEKVDGELNPRLLRRFAPLPEAPEQSNSELVRLGRILYFEPLLSRNGKISCNSCHPLDHYGTTRSRFSLGVDGKPGRRNAPTVYNAAGHFRQFWDGRAADLVGQAIGPLVNPAEMGMDAAGIKRVLEDIPGYRNLFAQAFPKEAEPVNIQNVAIAVAQFERGLITPARWDRYLAGDTQALTPAEKEGAKLFANLGCMVCHTGAYVGGTMFEKLGVFVPWPNQSDHGRSDLTHNPADDMVFKVPSLRNVAQTAPYFHDGSVDSLDAAVRTMARHQLGVDLTEEEAVSIATWLGSLTGEIPREYITPPRLPDAKRP